MLGRWAFRLNFANRTKSRCSSPQKDQAIESNTRAFNYYCLLNSSSSWAECSNCVSFSHMSSDWSYPFHLTRYWSSPLICLCFSMASTSNSTSPSTSMGGTSVPKSIVLVWPQQAHVEDVMDVVKCLAVASSRQVQLVRHFANLLQHSEQSYEVVL